MVGYWESGNFPQFLYSTTLRKNHNYVKIVIIRKISIINGLLLTYYNISGSVPGWWKYLAE